MSMTSGSDGNGTRSEINVTPLIDVLLVLLIIFMVIVPVTPSGLKTLVPQPPKDAQAEPSPETIVVQVLSGKSGEPSYRINDQSFAKAEVEPKLASIFAARAEKVMFVKGDPELEYGSVAEVVNFGRKAGVETIGIVTKGRD